MSNKKVEALIRRVVQADAIEQSRLFMARSKELNKKPIPEESIIRLRKNIDNRKTKKRKRLIYSIFRDKDQK